MFGFLPHNLFTNHIGQSSSGLSPRLWSRVTGSMMQADGSKRLVLAGDDFVGVKNADTYTDLYSEHGYTSYIDTGGTLLGLADEKGGVLALTTDGTDEDEIWISLGDGTQQLLQISDTAADAHLTAFECRFKVNTITDSQLTMFIGLAEPGLAAADTLVDATGALKANTSFLGFHNLLDGNGIDCIYQSTDAAATPVRNVNLADAGVPVADTFIKMGFVYDPDAPASKRITWYVNNVEQSTYVTATQIAAAQFPDAEALTFLAGYKNTTAVAGELAIDWWAAAQIIT